MIYTPKPSFYTFFSTSLLLSTILPFITCDAFKDGNDPHCPCLQSVHNNTQRFEEDASCLESNFVVDKFVNKQQTFCYPETYGVGCDQHDLNIAPFCDDDSSNNPSFCDRSFCYVDPEQCHSSNSTYGKSMIYPDLYYSYSVCGEKDTFQDYIIESELVGRTLKVGVPALHFPNHYRLNENEEAILFSEDINDGVGELKGIYIDFLLELANSGNFEVEFHPVSRGSHLGPEWSAWSGCIFDVSRGLLDMCVGNFWETSLRRSVVTFSTPLINEHFYMMVPKPKVKDDVITQLALVFEPFTPSLWAVIVVATFLVGIMYTILGSKRRVTYGRRCIKFTPRDIATNIYFSWAELLQGADLSRVKNTAQRIVAIAWSFFILIIIASYTANLAAFLGNKKVFFEIKNVDDCMRKECVICYEQTDALDKTLSSTYPTLRRRMYGNVTFMAEMLKLDECDAILMSKYDWDLNPHLWLECDQIFTGDSMLSFNVAWPVSLSILPSLSYWSSKALEVNGFERILNIYKAPPRCVEAHNFELNEAGPKITVTSMGGPLLILGMGILFGICMKYKDDRSSIE